MSVKEISLKEKFFSAKTALSLLIAFVVFYLLFTRVDFHAVVDILRKTKWGLFILAFPVFYFSIYVRGIRWELMLKNIGFQGDTRSIVEILFISWFANVIVPAKLGDLYRSYLMDRNYRFSVSKTLGSVFTERIFDMLILFILFGITGLYSFQGKLPQSIVYLLLSGFLMAAILITGLLLMKFLGGTIKRILPRRIEDIYGRFEIGALGSIDNVLLIVAYTVIVWFSEAARLYLVTLSCGLHLPLMLVIFVALASSLLTALPITPAGLGAVEFAIVGILLTFGLDKNMSVSVAILDRIVSYWSVLAFGYMAFVFSKKC